MFGYIKPYEPELKVKELKIYKSVYCGLCKSLGKFFGRFSRLTLSYDCTFLTLLSLALKNTHIDLKSGRCVVNVFKKCIFCPSSGEEFKFAGAVSVIMTYYKILDDIRDSSLLNLSRNRVKIKKLTKILPNMLVLSFNFVGLIFKKICLFVFLQISKFSHRKSARLYPNVLHIIKNQMKNQEIIEKKDKVNIDESAESTGKMLEGIFGLLSENKAEKRILERFGYFIGKWVYLLDAVDDLKKDLNSGSFNPFITNLKKEPEHIKNYCGEVLNQVLTQVILAYNLLELNNFREILNNIITLGLKQTQEKILQSAFEL
ncbi:MAG: DUF5685 family protein [Oscillospiraceae bacterium]|nr:DUF5685 family protein [Oscillospiraceae bacterium]